MKFLLKAVGIFVCLIAIVSLGVLVVAQFRTSDATVEGQNADLHSANTLAVLAPSFTPVPLATATPRLTATREPTATRPPTATAVPLDPATIAYVQEMMLDTKELIDVMSQVGDLLATPLPNDSEWNRQIQAAISQLQAIHNRQVPINPPAMFAYYHLLFIEATEFCSFLDVNFPPNTKPTLTDIQIARMRSLTCYDILMETMEEMPELPAGSNPGLKQVVSATPTSTTLPVQSAATVAQNSNLRAGPGTEYPIAGSITSGTLIVPIARNDAGDWLLLDSGVWIAAFLVNGAGDLPIAD